MFVSDLGYTLNEFDRWKDKHTELRYDCGRQGTAARFPLATCEECGDGITTGNEQCDDGNTVDTDGCTATCTGFCQIPLNKYGVSEQCGPCGNSKWEAGESEQCDDGNRITGDGCDDTC